MLMLFLSPNLTSHMLAAWHILNPHPNINFSFSCKFGFCCIEGQDLHSELHHINCTHAQIQFKVNNERTEEIKHIQRNEQKKKDICLINLLQSIMINSEIQKLVTNKHYLLQKLLQFSFSFSFLFCCAVEATLKLTFSS